MPKARINPQNTANHFHVWQDSGLWRNMLWLLVLQTPLFSEGFMDSSPPPPSSGAELDHARYLLALSEHVKTIGIYNQTLRDGAISPTDRAMLLEVTHHLCADSGAQGFPLIAEHARILDGLLSAQAPLTHLVLSQKLANLYEICNAAIELEEASERATPANKPVIVVVDDDPMIRLAMTSLLGKEANVLTGKNSHDALRLMREHKPALVLMDDIMPGGVTGLSLLEDIRMDAELSRIPVVMVTASSEKENVLRGLKAGATDYITKPFVAEKLKTVVRGILNRREHCVALCLSDKTLERDIAQRLESLSCKTHAGFADPQTFLMFLKSTPALAVCDGNNNTLTATALQQTQACTLYIPEEDEDIPEGLQSETFSVLTDAPTPESIVRAIGRLLAAQRKKQQASA